MDLEQTLLSAIAADPGDEAAWLALADSLEEQGSLDRAELVRLRSQLAQPDLGGRERAGREKRLHRLLSGGVVPAGPRQRLEVAEGSTLELALLPPGRFWMGSPEDEPDRMDREGPLHLVTLTRGFWLGACEVSQVQWQAVMGDNPSEFRGDRLPVERVSWDEAELFCRRVGERCGRVCRLPTEAEWEYACRAGSTTPFHTGRALSAQQANYDGNYPYRGGTHGPYRERTTAVGAFAPNAWGLFDMHGNVDEWCGDGMRRFTGRPVSDPRGRKAGERCIRGGSWYGLAHSCRSACRYDSTRVTRSAMIGFRMLAEVG